MCSSARAHPPSFTASKVSTNLAGRMPFQTRSLMPTRGVWGAAIQIESPSTSRGTTAHHAKWGLQVHTSLLFPSTSLFFHLVQHSSLLNNQGAATTCHTTLMSTLALLKKPSALQRRTGRLHRCAVAGLEHTPHCACRADRRPLAIWHSRVNEAAACRTQRHGPVGISSCRGQCR